MAYGRRRDDCSEDTLSDRKQYSQRMVINGHRVERKITSHDLFGAVEGPASWRPGEGVHDTGKLREPAAFGVGACLSVSNTRSTMPRPTGDLPTINGFGVFIPKSVSGSGEAVFQ